MHCLYWNYQSARKDEAETDGLLNFPNSQRLSRLDQINKAVTLCGFELTFIICADHGEAVEPWEVPMHAHPEAILRPLQVTDLVGHPKGLVDGWEGNRVRRKRDEEQKDKIHFQKQGNVAESGRKIIKGDGLNDAKINTWIYMCKKIIKKVKSNS